MENSEIKRGDIVDVNIAGEWKERYGIVNEIKEDEIVWTMRFAGHDGCCWTYSWRFGIRLTTPQGSNPSNK